jgi:hypothetical protein
MSSDMPSMVTVPIGISYPPMPSSDRRAICLPFSSRKCRTTREVSPANSGSADHQPTTSANWNVWARALPVVVTTAVMAISNERSNLQRIASSSRVRGLE